MLQNFKINMYVVIQKLKKNILKMFYSIGNSVKKIFAKTLIDFKTMSVIR